MSVSPFNSAIYGSLYADPDVIALFSDEAEIRAMLRVEAALAMAEGEVGVIPREAARRIAEVAGSLVIEPTALAQGTASAGVPIPALVSALRSAVGDEAATFVHWGATSQDVIDTGLVIRLGDALGLIEARLASLSAHLADLARAHRRTLMVGRTRTQYATPTTFGLKIAGWRAPLARHVTRLGELRGRLLMVSFGGAVGTLAALGEKGLAVEAAMAKELGLGVAELPWHAQRDGLVELAGWLSLVTGSLGKICEDLMLLAQSEVAEVLPGSGGGSSTMPQKANPVGAEALVALARFNAGLVATMHHALATQHERDGAAWQTEWLALPQMVVATGAALLKAGAVLDDLNIDPARMRDNLDASNGLALAEAASFALSAHMPRAEAQALVKEACGAVAETGRHLIDLLSERSDAPVDWDPVRDPENYLGVADALIDRALGD
jgi:3-carboxy-cis,cis-muconate cycloisomerase